MEWKSKFSEIDGETESGKIAAKFNEFFCDVGQNLASNIPNSLLELDFTPIPGCMFELQEVPVSDIAKILSEMSSAKATGDDNVSIKFLKYHIDFIAPMLTHIINLSLRTCVVPQQWKCAVVKPLYKDAHVLMHQTIGPLVYCQLVVRFWKKSFIANCMITCSTFSCYRRLNLDSGCTIPWPPASIPY